MSTKQPSLSDNFRDISNIRQKPFMCLDYRKLESSTNRIRQQSQQSTTVMILNTLKQSTLAQTTSYAQLETIQSELIECGSIFSDLVNSENQWSQIPQIVHLTLKSIGQFLEALDRKSSKVMTSLQTTFSRLISSKVGKQEMQMRLAEYQSRDNEVDRSRSVDFKLKREMIDTQMLEQIKSIAYLAVQNKLEHLQYSPGKSASPSPNKSELHNILESNQLMSKELSRLQQSIKVCQAKLINQALSSPQKRTRQQLKDVKQLISNLQKGVEQSLLEKGRGSDRMDSRVGQISNQVGSLTKMMQQILRTKVDRREFVEFKSKTTKQLLEKIKLQEVEEVIKSLQSEMQNRIQDVKNEARKLEKTMTKQHKHDIQDLRKILERYGEKDKPPSNSNTSLTEIKLSLGRMERKISENKMETKEQRLQQVNSDELTRFWKRVQNQLQLRDQKLCQTIQESKDTLRTEYRTARSKSNKDHRDKDNQKVLTSICNQLVLGRWISTRLNSSHCCVWEQQTANTMTQNFIWENQSVGILVVSPGVYRIEFGFFSTSGNLPSVIINGDIALKALDSKYKEIKKHPNGYINGSTLIQLLLLPARGRLSIQMAKHQDGEAYMALYKL